jgi:dephospho-CoA kinase
MNAYGLTGNMGCGKSFVATLFAKLPGVTVFDTDKIAKEIITCRAFRNDVAEIVGAKIFLGDTVDFKSLAKIVFEQTEKRQALEKLLHPIVWKAVQEKVESVAKDALCLVESAIIFETKSEVNFKAIIAVTCNQEEQFRRLTINRKMSLTDIQIRLAHQLSQLEKVTRSQFVIHTDCDLVSLQQQVESLYNQLKIR